MDRAFCAQIKPADSVHPLLWKDGTPVSLPTLGGTMNNVAITINDRREIDGTSNLSGDTTTHAVLWRNRAITDLRTLPGDVSSAVNGMNNKGQVVGDSYSGRRGCDCRFAVVRAASALAHPSIDIVASNWKFTPNTFELYVGETATLRMTSSEGVHGLQSRRTRYSADGDRAWFVQNGSSHTEAAREVCPALRDHVRGSSR